GDGSSGNSSFQISGNELQTNAVLSSIVQSSYSIRVRSTDALGNSIEQQFTITVSNTDPVTPLIGLTNSTVASGQPSGPAVGTLSPSGPVVPSQITYTLVSGVGSDDNSSFQIVDNKLQTSGPLSSGVHTVRVRSNGTFLISDVVDLSGISGPTA